MEEHRASPFTESLSKFMVVTAALGAFIVLFDPKFTLTFWGQIVTIGGDGFSADLKGAVISAILIGGWTAVKEYWLGSSLGNVKSAESVQRIAEGVPPAGTTLSTTDTSKTTASAAIPPTAADPLKGQP